MEDKFHKVITSFLNFETKADDFVIAYMKLWRQQRDDGESEKLDSRFQRLTDTIFTACDAYDSGPDEEWEIDEAKLKQEVSLLSYIWWGN